MDGRRSRASIAFYREWKGGGSIEIELAGQTYQIRPGDWLLYELVRPLGVVARRSLGPPLKARALERSLGIMVAPGQRLVRPGSGRAGPGSDPTRPPIRIGVATDGPAPEDVLPILRRGAGTREEIYAWARRSGLAWIVVPGEDTSVGWLARIMEGGAGPWAPAPDLEPGRAYRVGPECLEAQAEPGTTCHVVDRAGLPTVDELNGPVLLRDPDVHLSAGGIAALVDVLRQDPSLDAVFPLHSLGDPVSLPMCGTIGSVLPRLAGGKSAREIDLVVRAMRPGLEHGEAPRIPGCALLSEALAARLIGGEAPVRIGRYATCLEAYAWRPREDPDGIASLLRIDTHGTGGDDWATRTAVLREVVRASRPATLPVALYSHAIGPWGGVAVLFRLADELARLGFAAELAYHNHTEHRFRPYASPRRVHSPDLLVHDPAHALGWREATGLIVGSHWYSGVTIRRLLKRHPGIVPTTILQDREDLFRNMDDTGPQLKPAQYQDYLAIGEGRAVAPWILESLQEEHAGFRPDRYDVIPAGVDCDVFRPGPRSLEEARSGPIRILAMERPGTAVRRGLGRLREVYAGLRERYPSRRVSLELFGWKDASGRHADPVHDIHHGFLAPEDLAVLMREVDIVVEPSEYQGFGLPGLEAMRSGACLVSTACRGVDAYAEHEVSALIVPHDELAGGVIRAIEDDQIRRQLRQAGPSAAAACDWRRVGATWALYLIDLARRSDLPARYLPGLDPVEDRAVAALDGTR